MRTTPALVTLALAAAACSGASGAIEATNTGSPGNTAGPTSTTAYPDASARFLKRMASEPRPVERSAIPPRHLNEEAFPKSLVERDRIVWGGVVPDAIAPIDRPVFAPADEIEFLEDDEAVLVLQLGDTVRGYPIQIMTWHEIVNDEVDGRPVSVTYCPLCNSGVALDRRLDDQVLDFGTSGSLYRSALVLYDRQTESLWTQFDGTAVIGDLVGAELDLLPVATVSWADFRDAHPDADVLTRDTGFNRSYGENPYRGYDSLEQPLSGWFTTAVDDRQPAFARLVGISGDDDAVGVVTATAQVAGVVDTELDGRPITVWHAPGTASPLDERQVADGADIGATGVFRGDRFSRRPPRAAGQSVEAADLVFRRDGRVFTDTLTGSRWNLLGEAVAGPLRGARLEPVPHLDTFWFAWSAHEPDARLVG